MKKAKKLSISVFLSLLALLLCIGTFPFYVSAESGTAPEGEAPVFSTYSGPWDGVSVSTSLTGDGLTEETAYIIATPADLAYLGLSSHSDNYTDKYFRLTANIDMGGYNLYTSDKNYTIGDISSPFAGIFDGQGYTISNFKIAPASYTGLNLGLFSYINSAEIENLNISSAVVGDSSVATAGIVAGNATNSTIMGCLVSCSSVKAQVYIGGIVGQAVGTTVKYCTNNAVVKDTRYASAANVVAGGILGYSTDSQGDNTIEYCANFGKISISPVAGGILSAGGIVGYVTANDSVIHCVNSAAVSGTTTHTSRITVGGISGRLRSNSAKTAVCYIDSCYNISATLEVTGATVNIGLINGHINSGKLRILSNKSVSVSELAINGGGTPDTDSGNEITATVDVTSVYNVINTNQAFKAHIAGVQENTSASSMRFIMCLDSLDYQSVEFRITASYTEGGVQKTAYNGYSPITSVYSSINADGQTVTPIEFGGKYFATMCVTGIPSGVGDIVFTVSAYVKDLSGNVILVDCGTCTYSSGS